MVLAWEKLPEQSPIEQMRQVGRSPLLRRWATYEIVTTKPLARVVEEILAIVGG
jgi:hypothetical protein